MNNSGDNALTIALEQESLFDAEIEEDEDEAEQEEDDDGK